MEILALTTKVKAAVAKVTSTQAMHLTNLNTAKDIRTYKFYDQRNINEAKLQQIKDELNAANLISINCTAPGKYDFQDITIKFKLK